MKITWPLIALNLVFICGGICCLALGKSDAGMLLLGAAVGHAIPAPVRRR